jgi:hypothetical protein
MAPAMCMSYTYILILTLSRELFGSARSFSYNLIQMRKDSPLAFRIQADLKKTLLKLAKQESRSLSQICEMLLKIGVDEYEKEGHKYLQRILVSSHSGDQG